MPRLEKGSLVGPLTEHVRNAPSRMLGVGASLMIIGLLLIPAAIVERDTFMQKVALFGFALMFGGLFIMAIGWIILDRQYKARAPWE